VFALQFHLEITPEIIDIWTGIWAEDIEMLHGPGAVNRLELETSAIWKEYRPVAGQIFKNWLRMITTAQHV